MEKQKAKASHSQKEKALDIYLDYACSLTLRKVNTKNKSRSKASAMQGRRGKCCE